MTILQNIKHWHNRLLNKIPVLPRWASRTLALIIFSAIVATALIENTTIGKNAAYAIAPFIVFVLWQIIRFLNALRVISRNALDL